MWNESATETVRIGSLVELDGVVAERIMAQVPEIYWEESYARLRFDSVHEALEAMRDPYYQYFIPEDERAADVLAEVREFPAYSTELTTAMEVVKRVSADDEPLHLRHHAGRWAAAFGWNSDVFAATAPQAICLAALLAKGIRVELEGSRLECVGLAH